MSRTRTWIYFAGVAAVVGWTSQGCATNPVSGKRQLALISEAQEIEMGKQADQEVAASIGLVADDKMQRYVQALGTKMAAASERPNLPWTFRVLDDASVNAFAIPGGFIYVTRGIMAHLNSEAELVAVIGHEIGHVTARHSVSQMSKQQLAQIGLVAGMILAPEVAQFGDLAQAGLGMLFLKFSRADESQADRLGFKYMLDGGYDPREMADVFGVLQKVSQQAGAGRLPQWMSSHPDPENRQAWATRAVANLNRDLSALAVNRQPYLRQLDGIVFGENPREGFFEGALFRHPDMAFRIEFPPGWKTSNQKQAVSAVSLQQDAVVALQGAGAPSAQQAAQQFFSQQGVEAGQPWRRQIGGFPAISYSFRARTEQGILRGLVAWVEYQNNVFRLLGYTPEQKWPQYERAFAESIASFNRETDRAVLDVKPRRLKIVELNHPATLEALLREYPSTVAAQTVALINNLAGNATLAAGDDFKRVIGGQLP